MNKRIIIVTVFLLTSNTCLGFDDEGFQYWNTIGIQFEIDKDWTSEISQDLRLGADGGNLYYSSTDIGFTHKGFSDRINIGIGYKEISEKNSNNEWQPEHRPHIDLNLRDNFFGLDFKNRSRFEFRDRADAEDLWRYRNKSSFELPFVIKKSKTQLYLAEEIFIVFNNQFYNNNRLFLGIKQDLSENLKSNIYYLWQTTRTEGQWKDIQAIGISLVLNF